MMNEDKSSLLSYFSGSYLERDESLIKAAEHNSPYENYTIKGIDHRLSMEWMWCWPWDDTAIANITESIPAIDGKLNSSLRNTATDEQLIVPKWPSARYNVVLSRTSGQWQIKNVTFVEYINLF